jgi:hypothetical protein
LPARYKSLHTISLWCLAETKEDLAIQVRGGYKTFGCGSRRVHVMKNFNMSVPRGNIYGLLGMLH